MEVEEVSNPTWPIITRQTVGKASQRNPNTMRFYRSLLCFLWMLALPARADVVDAIFSAATDVSITANGYDATGNTVNITLNHAPAVGAELMIVKNTGLGFIQGNFNNLAHGQVVPLNFSGTTYQFVANYYGGSGNDLVLVWAVNRLYAWGDNTSGVLGRELAFSPMNRLPTQFPLTPDLLGKTIIAIASGHYHALMLCSDGSMFTWGMNSYGQLGNAEIPVSMFSKSILPVRVEIPAPLADKQVVAISAGSDHNLALCSDGTILAWGWNAYGQCGNGSTTNVPLPQVVGTTGTPLEGKTVISVSAGAVHNLALCSDGTLAGWGDNLWNQLGTGNTDNAFTPVLVSTSGVLAGKSVVQIEAGGIHSMALCSDGTLAVWGENNYGQLGDDTTLSRPLPVAINSFGVIAGKTVTDISAGFTHCLALCSDGSLVAWGSNAYGEYGTGNTTSSLTPVLVDTTGVLNGNVISDTATGGDSILGECSFAVTTDGVLTAWGSNYDGELGDGTTTNRHLPVTVDTTQLGASDRFIRVHRAMLSPHSLAIVATPPAPEIAIYDGTTPFVNERQSNSSKSYANTLVGAHQPHQLTITNKGDLDLSNIQFSFAGSHPGDFTVHAFSNTPIAPGASRTFTVNFSPIAAGSRSAVLQIASNDSDENPFLISLAGTAGTTLSAVYQTGNETPLTTNGFTATGNTINFTLQFHPTPGRELTIVKNTGLGFIQGEFNGIAHGQTVTLNYGGKSYPFIADYYGGSGNDLTLIGDMEVYAWGLNTNGRLGVGDTSYRSEPTPVSTSGVLANKTVFRVAGGAMHSLALCSDGTLAAWGDNEFGQLGDGTTTDRHSPVAVDISGVLAGKKVVAIAAGDTHSMALCADGTVACWGSNQNGQLGDGSIINSSVPVAVNSSGALAGKTVGAIAPGPDYSAALCTDGSVIVWSADGTHLPRLLNPDSEVADKKIVEIRAGLELSALCSDGTLLHWPGDDALEVSLVNGVGVLQTKTATTIASGAVHTLALCSDGTLVSWGENDQYGQQGQGPVNPDYNPGLVDVSGVLAGKTVTQIAAGVNHSLALCSDGTLAGWGYDMIGGSSPALISTLSLPDGACFARLSNGSRNNHNLALMVIPQFPEIRVFKIVSMMSGPEQQSGVGTTTFPGKLIGTSGTPQTFKILNTGSSPLNGLTISKSGSHPGDFTFTAPSQTSLDYTQSTTFTVTFAPATTGLRTASIRIASNDSDENPFIINVSGTGLSQLESWRQTYFGTTSNTGNAANNATPMKDGVNNLLKFATGMNPTQSGTMPGIATIDGDNIVFTYTRSKAAKNAGFIYTVEWSNTLVNPFWTWPGVNESFIDQGATELVTATLSTGNSDQRFVRLTVTAPP